MSNMLKAETTRPTERGAAELSARVGQKSPLRGLSWSLSLAVLWLVE